MESILSSEEIKQLNTLWHNVRARVENVETPADFLLPKLHIAPNDAGGDVIIAPQAVVNTKNNITLKILLAIFAILIYNGGTKST